MSTKNYLDKAVILIDPVSSGRFLKEYVLKSGHKLIGIFTLSEEALKTSGKHIPHDEKVKHCDVIIYSDEAEKIMNKLTELPFEIMAVIPASEPGVELADKLAHCLGVKGNPISSSLARRDKYETRLAIQKADLCNLEFTACKTRDEALAFASSHTLPIVVKTPKGAGAHHVFVCNHLDEVATAFEQVMRDPNIFGDATSFALLEGYLSGQQYAIELFGDGETLHVTSIWRLDFRKNSFGKSIFEKMATVIDAAELEEIQELKEYAIAVGQAVGIQWGPCLIELRDDPIRGPSLIEIGARLSGIDMPVLIKESSSFDPFESTIEIYLAEGKFKFEPVRFLKYASLVFFPVDGHGTVEDIQGIDTIQRLPSYVMSHLHITPGEYIPPSSDLASIPLYVYLAHKDKTQLEMDMAEIKRVFQIRFRSPAIPVPMAHAQVCLT